MTRQIKRATERVKAKAVKTARKARSLVAASALTLGALVPSPASASLSPELVQRLNEPSVTAENFNGATQELRIGEAVIKLTDYQLAAVQDKSRIAIFCWCRQAGKDFTAALIAVLDALETGNNWYIVSLTQRQALATAKKAQQHAKAIGMLVGDLTESTTKDKNGFDQTSYGVRLPNGAEIIALPGKDPDALAGLSGNVIFTEMALFPKGGVDHWRVVFPLATRGFRILAISTPRGPDTKFSELRRNPKGKYSVHNVTIHDAVRMGLELRDDTGKIITPAELKELYNDESGWQREYECIEGEDWDPLISWEHLNACLAKYDLPWIHVEGMEKLDTEFAAITEMIAKVRASMTGTPVFGYDVAATGDLAAVPFGEKIGDVVWHRGLVTMHKVDDFEWQRKVVRLLLTSGFTGVGDASGIGRDTCQQLEKDFPIKFKGVVFTGDSKGALCVQMMQACQAVKLRLAQAVLEVQYDLHSLAKKSVGVAKRLQVLAQPNTLLKHSHADIAIGISMMIDAAQGACGAISCKTVTPRDGEFEHPMRNVMQMGAPEMQCVC